MTPLPAARVEAERLARELYDAFPVGSPQNAYRVDKSGWTGWDYTQATPWEEQTPEWRDRLIDAHLALLLDFDRPASRDWWARWLAAKVGIAVGATAPAWICDDDDGRRSPRWILDGGGDWNDRIFFDPQASHNTGGDRWLAVSGISSAASPAASLRLAVEAVGDSPHPGATMILLLPSPAFRDALLAGGPCGARPPMDRLLGGECDPPVWTDGPIDWRRWPVVAGPALGLSHCSSEGPAIEVRYRTEVQATPATEGGRS